MNLQNSINVVVSRMVRLIDLSTKIAIGSHALFDIQLHSSTVTAIGSNISFSLWSRRVVSSAGDITDRRDPCLMLLCSLEGKVNTRSTLTI